MDLPAVERSGGKPSSGPESPGGGAANLELILDQVEAGVSVRGPRPPPSELGPAQGFFLLKAVFYLCLCVRGSIRAQI